MRKLMLIVTICVVIVCLSFYIIDFRLPGDGRIGQQEDLKNNEQPEFYYEQIIVSNDALALAPVQTAAASTPAAMPAAASESVAPAASPTFKPSPWTLVWADEFDKPSLNMEYWTKVDRRNNYNGELQYYKPANVYVQDGILYLEARKERKDGKKYTSGMIETAYKLDFLYGRFEARISLPSGKGIFPAFWLLAYESGYEIDVLEMIGSEPHTIYGVNHYVRRESLCKNVGHITVDDPAAFHIYAVEWDEKTIRWYVDDEMYYTARRGVPAERMYLILTLAVGGIWPGKPDKKTEFPSLLAVDYIRYYIPSAAEAGENNDRD